MGESHGDIVGILVDGCPPGISLSEDDFVVDIQRRKSGSTGTTSRIEIDKPILKSGIFDGYSTGAPILILFENNNIKSKDYSDIKTKPRPGHADFTSFTKYLGYNDYRGGGHFSGRLTLGLVAAGVIAKKIIKMIEIKAKLIEIGGTNDITQMINRTLSQNDSIGGLIECKIDNLPIGFGEPYFDSIESNLSHLIFSIPAIKGIEFGSGFNSATMLGSEYNDEYIDVNGKTKTNHSGGINGGISNGNQIYLRVAVKPASSIAQEQQTINLMTGELARLKIEGRHDSCIALRVPPVLEACCAIVLADFYLISKTNQSQ